MKGLILVLLLSSAALADGVIRPRLTPYRRILTLTWSQIPYPHVDNSVTFTDGNQYTVWNPDGIACEPRYSCGQKFECHVTIYLDEAVIDAGRLIE